MCAGLAISLIGKAGAGAALGFHQRHGGVGPAAPGGLLDGGVNLP
jgi:hypothetical protein